MTGSSIPKVPDLDQPALLEVLDELSQQLKRRNTRATIYVVGGAAMALAYGRGRTTRDVDAWVESGGAALLQATRAIAVERNWDPDWLNLYTALAVPKPNDGNPPVFYESPWLVVTGASPECLLAMKLEAGRTKDIRDIEHLLEVLNIEAAEDAMKIHGEVLPLSTRQDVARAVLNDLATTRQKEWPWRKTLAEDRYPRYTFIDDPRGYTLRVQRSPGTEHDELGSGLTLEALVEAERMDRGWPKEADAPIRALTQAEIEKMRVPGRG